MDTRQILRWGILAGIFTIPFIPLIIANGMFFPFIVGKNFTFRIIVELMAGGFVALMLLDRTYRPRFGALLGAVAAFLLAIGIADLLGENPWKSFWSNFERMEGFITLLHLGAYFVILASVLRTEKLWRAFWNTSVGVSVLLGIYGLFQLGGIIVINQGGVRLDATFGNATYLAIYMVFHIFLTAWLMLSYRGASWVKYMYGAIMVLQTYILYYTATRGAILGFVGGVLLSALLVALTMRGDARLRKIAIGAIGAVVLLVGGFMAVRNTAFVQNHEVLGRLATISLEGGNARFMVWGMAMEGVKERPIFGWGQENFIYVFTKHYNPGMYAQEPWFDRVHNVFLDWLIAGGVVGLISYLAIFGVALWLLWISKRAKEVFSPLERSLLTGLFAAYFFHNLFVFDNIVSYILFFSVLAFIHYRSTIAHLDPDLKNAHPARSNLPAQMVLPGALIATVLVVYLVNWDGYRTNTALLRAISPNATSGPTENLTLFKEALAYDALGRQEVKEQMLQAAVAVSRANGLDPMLKQDFVTTARTAMAEEVESNPNDARLQLFMGSFLNMTGSPDEGRPYIEKALTLSPNKQAILFELGLNDIVAGRYERALATFKTAFELAPEFNQARISYAAAAAYANQFDLVSELLMPKFNTLAVDNDQLLNAYFQTKRYDLVVAIWEGRIKKNPDNIQFRVSLAASYLLSGERQKAIGQLEEAIKLDPSFKQQGEFFISEIKAGRNP